MPKIALLPLLLLIGLLHPGTIEAAVASGNARFVRLDALWARTNETFHYEGGAFADVGFEPMQSWRGTVGLGWRRPSGLMAGVELGLTDRGGSLQEYTVFRPDNPSRLEFSRRYLDVGLPVGWRLARNGSFVELAAIPRVSIRLERPWWMTNYEYSRAIAGLDPQLSVGHGFWHVTGRYQFDLTPAWSHDNGPGKSPPGESAVTRVESHDSGFSFGLGIELPF